MIVYVDPRYSTHELSPRLKDSNTSKKSWRSSKCVRPLRFRTAKGARAKRVIVPDATDLTGRPVGSLAAAISMPWSGCCTITRGRGPTHARTTIGPDTIVVTLRGSLTTAERTLAQSGQDLEVLAMRRAFQNTMRDDMITVVEQLTSRSVEAFLSDNLYDPVAVEISSCTTPTAMATRTVPEL